MVAFQTANGLYVSQMVADLTGVIRALEAEGIPVLCLKGPALATLLYGDPALRDFGDLDILVQASDYARAQAVLAAMGLAPFSPTTGAMGRAFALARERHCHFFSLHHHYWLELHWRVASNEFPRALDTAGLFDRRQEVVVNGQLFSTLSYEDTVMHLCHHGAQHRWKRFRYMTDLVAAWEAMDEKRWDVLVNAAQKQGLYGPLLIGARLCHDLLGMALPERIARACSRGRVARWIVPLVQVYYSRSPGSEQYDSHLLMLPGLLTAEGGRARSILALLALAFRPTVDDYRWVHLPPSLRWLYGVLSPIRRIWDGLDAVGACFHRRCVAIVQDTRGKKP
jgi:hypothetical protein